MMMSVVMEMSGMRLLIRKYLDVHISFQLDGVKSRSLYIFNPLIIGRDAFGVIGKPITLVQMMGFSARCAVQHSGFGTGGIQLRAVGAAVKHGL